MTDRKVELGDTLWFVNHCGGCPLLKRREKALPVCSRRRRVVRDENIVQDDCPLEVRA